MLRLVTGEGLRLAAVGTVAGLAMAFVAARVMDTFLYGVATTDLMTFLATPVVVAFVTLVACLVLAARAMRINPLTALRAE